MLSYFLRRCLQAIPVFIILSFTILVLIRIVPGDPAVEYLGGAEAEFTYEDLEKAREILGLDKPLLVQYGVWLSGLIRGDMGDSFFHRRPVQQMFLRALPVTLQLAFISIPFAVLVGVPLGIFTALHRGKITDYIATTTTLAGLSMPDFWLGILLILLFTVHLGWLPTSGYVRFEVDAIGNIKRIIMPSLTLAIIMTAPFMRFTRSSILDILGMDYIRVARAKGLHERTVVYKHALKNALIPILTLIGLNVAMFFGGAAVIETVFSLPGVGRLLVNGVGQRDYVIVQNLVVIIGAAYIFVNLLVDLLYGVVDPRVVYK